MFRPCSLCNQTSSNTIFEKDGYSLVQCSACEFVYLGNPPTQAELERLYSFDSGYHLDLRDDEASQMKRLALARQHYELLKRFKSGGRILDIGCSAGHFLKVAKDDGWDAYGIELSKDTAELAARRFGLKITTGGLEENSFAPNFFDAVTMWDVIEHVEDPLRLMNHANKILKDEGIVILLTPNIDGLFPKLSQKVANLIKYWPHPEPPYHLSQFSKTTLYKLLKLTGFEVLQTVDEMIPISYTFGDLKSIVASPKRLIYSSLFIPVALLGAKFHSGDSIIVVARKTARPDVL
jgi:2-polyprenyl-3-methyl-5-hydroxy-6-metoxy-1,4-benzoquinol methylase